MGGGTTWVKADLTEGQEKVLVELVAQVRVRLWGRRGDHSYAVRLNVNNRTK